MNMNRQRYQEFIYYGVRVIESLGYSRYFEIVSNISYSCPEGVNADEICVKSVYGPYIVVDTEDKEVRLYPCKEQFSSLQDIRKFQETVATLIKVAELLTLFTTSSDLVGYLFIPPWGYDLETS